MDSSLNIRNVAAPAASSAGRPESQGTGRALPQGLPKSGEKLPERPAPEPTPERIRQAVQQIQSYLNDSQRQLQFQVDADSGRTIVRVVNPETKELIRQIPGEEVLKLARAIGANGGQIISDLV
ncbi:MAG: flagellar protein FlaG [Gammaproteobacteria bacterium]|nr:flagellar protein FlaG [Gammaproteobacteria bacterium]